MYFEEWPFHIIPERVPEVWADRNRLYADIRDLFGGLHQKRKSVFACIWGYFGSGKSHTLLHFKNKLEKEGHFFVYSKMPKQINCFLDLYRQAFANRLDVIRLSRIVHRTWSSLVEHKTEDGAFQTIYSEVADQWLDFAQAAVVMAKAAMTTRYLTDPLFRLSLSWLMGERLGKRDLRSLGMTRNIENDQDAVGAVDALVRLFGYARESAERLPQVIWALDDSQFLAALRDTPRKVIQQGMRDAFDGCPTDFCLLMSFTSTDAQKAKSLLIEDLQSRMVGDPFQISELTRDEALQFVLDLTNYPRFGKAKGSDKFHPFDQEALEKAIDLIQGVDYVTPRNLMKYLGALVSAAEKTLYPKPISSDYVKNYFAGLTLEKPH